MTNRVPSQNGQYPTPTLPILLAVIALFLITTTTSIVHFPENLDPDWKTMHWQQYPQIDDDVLRVLHTIHPQSISQPLGYSFNGRVSATPPPPTRSTPAPAPNLNNQLHNNVPATIIHRPILPTPPR